MANKNFTVKNGLEVGGQEVISSSGAITSAALGGQVLGTSASPSFANITTAGYLRGPASFVIDPAAHGDDTGTVVIAGNLQVDGTQTTINSTTMTVDDLNLTLASGAANAAAANGAGITVDITGATNPSLVYGSSNDDWTFNKNLNVTGNGSFSGNLDVVGQIAAYNNPGSSWGKMILRATDFEFKNAGGTIVGSIDTSNHFRIINDLQMDSSSPRIDYDNGDSNGSLRLFSGSRNAQSQQFFPNGHAHFNTTAGTFRIEGVGSSSNQIESNGSLKVRAAGGHVDLLDGTTEVLNTTTTGVRLPLNLVVDDKVGIGEPSPAMGLHVGNAIGVLFGPTTGASTYISSDHENTINGGYGLDTDTGDLWVNYRGYQNGTSRFRDFRVGDGKEGLLAIFDGSTSHVGIGIAIPEDRLHISGGNILLNNGIELRTKDTGGNIRTIVRANSSNELEYGWSANAPVKFMGGGAYTERMRIHTDGNIVINKGGFSSLPTGSKLNIFGDGVTLRLDGSSQTTKSILFRQTGVTTPGEIYADGSLRFRTEDANTRITFHTASSGTENERLRITSSGQVGIGTDNPTFRLHAYHPTTNVVGRFESGDAQVWIDLHDSNSGSYGALIGHDDTHLFKVADGNVTERLVLDNSGNLFLQSASQNRIVFGNTGDDYAVNNSNNWIRGSAGSLQFNSASTGYVWEAAGAARLTMSQTGVITQTTAGTGDSYDMILRSTDGGDSGLAIVRDNTVGFGIAVRASTTDYADFQLNTAGQPGYTETGKMRIYSGSISIPGTASWSSGVGHVLGDTGAHYMIRTSTSVGNESMIISNTVGSGGALGVMQYRNGGAVRGDYLIADNTNGIYFNSSSDYRFKENVTEIPNGYLDKLTSLRPVTYTHSADMDDDTTTVHSGFIAHEVAEVFPEFVLGDKDAVYTQEDLDAKGDQTTVTESVGDPLYQTVAYSKKEWNVYIVKALQELKAENESLKARIEVLEG